MKRIKRIYEMNDNSNNIYEKIIECFEYLKNEDIIINFIDNYSGRGMFGKKCVGIVVKDVWKTSINILRYIYENYPEDADEILDTLLYSRQDSFGLDTIIYFPYLSIEE